MSDIVIGGRDSDIETPGQSEDEYEYETRNYLHITDREEPIHWCPNLDDTYDGVSVASLDQLHVETENFIRSGYEREHQNIVQYMTTGDQTFLDKAEIQFEFLPGMDYVICEQDPPLKSQAFQVLSKFRDLLNAIRDSPSNESIFDNHRDEKQFLHFPLLYRLRTKEQSIPKAKPKNPKMLEIHNLVVQRRVDEAIEMCLSLMVDEPSNPQPLKILSFLYDDMGDIENSLKV
ncbi:hypothetical protein RF11_07911 [Thelohanellus kitauei]|uniref:Uncharacterized protein n=1 Tax=Thelohanellus kitauei TaxID=669202 RepID=A0A0C2M8A8_THEKT|nr:hypothetical protein RF11_07911 [Thelohanellus kitauei]